MKFFDSVKKIFSKIIGFGIITSAALVCATDVKDDGIGLNGFLSFLIWIGLMILLIKFPAVYASVVSVVVVFGLYVLKNGANGKVEKYVMMIVGMGALFLIMKNFNKILDFFLNSFKLEHSRSSSGIQINDSSDDYYNYNYDDYYSKSSNISKNNSDPGGLVSGSDEYWKIKEQAERIYRAVAGSTGYERDLNIKRANNLADRLREQYGFNDPQVNHIIKIYYLDWKS